MAPRLLPIGWHSFILLFISWYPAAEEKEKGEAPHLRIIIDWGCISL